MQLDEYQKQANLTDQAPGKDERALVFPLMGLASEVGALVNQYKKKVRDRDAHELFSERVAEELGDCLWYIANLAEKLDLKLEDIAQLNLRRIGERWPQPGSATPVLLLDEGCTPDEQLPRRVSVRFVEGPEHKGVLVRLFRGDEQLGNDLKDMAWDPDGYRFHDAFHLTYAALLGWSPITRFFFNCDRKSDARLREVEDSGRAKVIEEGIAAFLFEYAREMNWLEGVTHIDSAQLATVRNLVGRLEVRVRTTREWQEAMLRSFEVWRALRDHGGGTLHLDLLARSIEFEPPA